MIGHNNLKKGDRVRLTAVRGIGNGPRHARINDNRKGITRQIKVEQRDGYFPDIGDNYIDEILFVERAEPDADPPGTRWEPIEMSPAHAKQMKNVRGSLAALGW